LVFADAPSLLSLFSDRSGQKDAAKNARAVADYCPLDVALQHTWAGMTKRQTKELNLHVLFTVLGDPRLSFPRIGIHR
jgi:ubiquitin-like 1-activating enzyme E1 A